eukprot:NODE_5964_length_892_cov_199.807542_g5735_i0.p1 GENE.NODE_5964_length_892_cov_199.807542_g5735_i0~~NODE_5964_length_892_cov_199.807542_g5735_i0.p1  ORF type:complete len:245 (-),score=45.97 NODE_5964_length_892_cov_199.807542_g5735_i0:79-813(-)
MTCMLHQKTRGNKFLVEEPVGSGYWKCSPGNECKGGGSGDTDSGEMVTCSVHGKQRKANHCTESVPGTWSCTPMSMCIGGPGGAPSTRYSPYGPTGAVGGMDMYGMYGGMQAWGVSNDPKCGVCATHGKKRTWQNLSEHAPGVWACSIDAPCKTEGGGTGEGTAQCEAHGRNRSVRHMDFDPSTQTYKCKPSEACKTSGAGKAALGGMVGMPPMMGGMGGYGYGMPSMPLPGMPPGVPGMLPMM